MSSRRPSYGTRVSCASPKALRCSFIIAAATAACADSIRGTGCDIEAGGARAYFCLCYGTVEVRALGERPLKYETAHHENPLWIGEGRTTRAPVINHMDAEFVMREELVGRWSPFFHAPGRNPH